MMRISKYNESMAQKLAFQKMLIDLLGIYNTKEIHTTKISNS